MRQSTLTAILVALLLSVVSFSWWIRADNHWKRQVEGEVGTIIEKTVKPNHVKDGEQ